MPLNGHRFVICSLTKTSAVLNLTYLRSLESTGQECYLSGAAFNVLQMHY